MESNATEKPVPREIIALLSDERLILRETKRAVTPFGGIAVFISFLGKIGLVEAVRQHMPIRWGSPNQIDPTFTFTAFLVAVLVGARRFAHASLLRGERALHALLGLDLVSYRRYDPQSVSRIRHGPPFPAPLRIPGGMADAVFAAAREGLHPGFGFDGVLSVTASQGGSLKRHNPRQHGRPSHHPLLAVLSEAHFLGHGWLRSGNGGTRRGVEEFLQEALALWGQREKIRLLRADSGFFDDKLLNFLQQRLLPYIVVARL